MVVLCKVELSHPGALNPNAKFDPSCDEETEDLGVDPARPVTGGEVGNFWCQDGQGVVFGRWEPAPILKRSSCITEKCSVANSEKS